MTTKQEGHQAMATIINTKVPQANQGGLPTPPAEADRGARERSSSILLPEKSDEETVIGAEDAATVKTEYQGNDDEIDDIKEGEGKEDDQDFKIDPKLEGERLRQELIAFPTDNFIPAQANTASIDLQTSKFSTYFVQDHSKKGRAGRKIYKHTNEYEDLKGKVAEVDDEWRKEDAELSKIQSTLRDMNQSDAGYLDWKTLEGLKRTYVKDLQVRKIYEKESLELHKEKAGELMKERRAVEEKAYRDQIQLKKDKRVAKQKAAAAIAKPRKSTRVSIRRQRK
jgi:hypothetical protein